jgi:HEPN domain-containing protein
MKKATREWLDKAEGDFLAARKLLKGRPFLSDSVGYHCQQAIEKYLKALQQELSLTIQRTHDITVLLDQLIPKDGTLRSLKRGTKTLTAFAVEYRYPGRNATPRQARWAFQKAEVFRAEMRSRLGLRTRRRK